MFNEATGKKFLFVVYTIAFVVTGYLIATQDQDPAVRKYMAAVHSMHSAKLAQQ